jgi:tRNA threonylcarbamoyladenosine biosynthesis protein TsaE
MELVSTSAAATRSVGACIGAVLEPNDVVVLVGDLGTGKTVIAQGIAEGLGVEGPVVSPTFTIAQEYEGRLRLNHLDVYRLDRVQEAIDLGLDELFSGAVTVIEWGDGVRVLLPDERLEITLAFLPPDIADDDTRTITISPLGPTWRARDLALTRAVESLHFTRDGAER